MPAPHHHPPNLRRIASHSPLPLPSPPSSPPSTSPTSPRTRRPGLRALSVSGVTSVLVEHPSYSWPPPRRDHPPLHPSSSSDGNDADDSDFEDEFLSVGSTARGRCRRPLSAMSVGVAAAGEHDENEEELLEAGGRVGLGLVGIEYPLSPPPEKAQRMLRRDSTCTIETLGSRRSRSPSSVRTSGGSEGMTMRMLGHAKADASVGVQAQQVSSPSNSPLHERLSLSTRSAPNASPWTVEDPATSRATSTSPRHEKSPSAASASLAEFSSWSRRSSMTPMEDIVPPSPSLSSSSPTSSRGSSSRPASRPGTAERATSAGPLGLTQYLSYGRRASLPLEPAASPPSPTPLPSPALTSAPPRPPQAARTRERSATAQLASETFSQLRSSISTSVLSLSGAGRLHHKGAPTLVAIPSPPAPVTWESVLTIRISFTVGGPAAGSANAFLLGLNSFQRGGTRPWDPRGGWEKRFPAVVSVHGDPLSDPMVSVEYEGGGRRTFNPGTLQPSEIMASVLAGPNQ